MVLQRISLFAGRVGLVWLAVAGLMAAEHHGTVKSAGLPLPGVTVTAVQGDKKHVTTSDENGRYSFSNLTDGVWTLEVEMLGFEKLTKEVGIAYDAPSPEWTLPRRGGRPLPRGPVPQVLLLAVDDQVDGVTVAQPVLRHGRSVARPSRATGSRASGDRRSSPTRVVIALTVLVPRLRDAGPRGRDDGVTGRGADPADHQQRLRIGEQALTGEIDDRGHRAPVGLGDPREFDACHDRPLDRLVIAPGSGALTVSLRAQPAGPGPVPPRGDVTRN